MRAVRRRASNPGHSCPRHPHTPCAPAHIADPAPILGGSDATLALGKWHQGQTPPYLPNRRGFDEFFGLPFSVDDGVAYLSSCGNHSAGSSAAAAAAAATEGELCAERARLRLGPQLPLPLLRQLGRNSSTIVEQPTDVRLLTSRLRDYAKDFVARKAASRWFVYFAFGHVHTLSAGITPDRQYAGCEFAGTTPRAFEDALAEVDASVGGLLEHISALGLARRTLTLFTSDNGPSVRWGLGAGSPGIFTGLAASYQNGTRYENTAKGSTWEGGVRMPAFAHWPGTVPPGSHSYTMVSTLDVLPSLVHIAGGAPPTGRVLDGTLSLADAILSASGSAPPRHAFLPLWNEPAYANASHRIFAGRLGRFKAHWVTSPGLQANAREGVVPPEWTHSPPLVFDVEADPAEQYPLTSPPPALLAELAAAKADAEAHLTPTSIPLDWGYEHALCCGVGCTPPCHCHCTDVPLPP